MPAAAEQDLPKSMRQAYALWIRDARAESPRSVGANAELIYVPTQD